MEKYLAIAALMALWGASLSGKIDAPQDPKVCFSLSTSFESEYISAGVDVAHNTLIFNPEASYRLPCGDLRVGATSFNAQSGSYTEENIYVGYQRPLCGYWSADVGATYYWYPNNNPQVDRTLEFFAGVLYEGAWVNPAAYVLYDIALEQLQVELGVGHSFDLARWGMKNFTLEWGALTGIVEARDTDSDQVSGKVRNAYSYFMTSVDLAYHFNEDTTLLAGVRAGFNNDEQEPLIGGLGRENTLGWGMQFSTEF